MELNIYSGESISFLQEQPDNKNKVTDDELDPGKSYEGAINDLDDKITEKAAREELIKVEQE